MSLINRIAKATEAKAIKQTMGAGVIEWRVRVITSPQQAAAAGAGDVLTRMLPALPGEALQDPEQAQAFFLSKLQDVGGLGGLLEAEQSAALQVAMRAVDGVREPGGEWEPVTLVPDGQEDAEASLVSVATLDPATARLIMDAATSRIMEARECVESFPGAGGGGAAPGPDGEPVRAEAEHAARAV